MAQQLSAAHKARVGNVADILSDLMMEAHRPIAAAALAFCVDELTTLSAAPAAAVAAATQAPPATSTAPASNKPAPKPPRTHEQRIAAAKLAAQTRAANKATRDAAAGKNSASAKTPASTGADDTTE